MINSSPSCRPLLSFTNNYVLSLVIFIFLALYFLFDCVFVGYTHLWTDVHTLMILVLMSVIKIEERIGSKLLTGFLTPTCLTSKSLLWRSCVYLWNIVYCCWVGKRRFVLLMDILWLMLRRAKRVDCRIFTLW